MNWQDHKKLAAALRDQGLADTLAARLNLRAVDSVVNGRKITLAHVVIAKCQQAVEKITKGYRLWHSASFDPTRGHMPFTGALGDEHHPEIDSLCIRLNRINPRVVRNIKWLESLAPRAPIVPDNERGLPVPLERLSENSEYAFWSFSRNKLVIAAEGLSLRDHAIPAAYALRSFLEAISGSGPEAFTKDVQIFLEEHPFHVAFSQA